MKQNKKSDLPIGAVIENGGTALANKTGEWRSMRPAWDNGRCVQCLICAVYCPDRAIHIIEGKRASTDFDYCKGCGICALVCPAKCIKMVEEEEGMNGG